MDGGVSGRRRCSRIGWKNIEQVVLSPATIFRQEPAFLIQDELPEARTYLAILESIGSGNRSPKAISEKCGIPLTHVGKYLNTLRNLAFVRRTITIDANDPAHSRMSLYEINDAFLNFHFSLLRPYFALIDQNRTGKVIEEIASRFNVFVARSGFERICRKFIMVSGDAKRLPFEPIEVGRLWNREVEIDVAAIDKKSKSALLGECKWTERPIACDVLDELQNKARSLKSIASFKKHFALFSKSGFTKDVVEKAKSENLLLFSVKDMGL